MQKISNTQKWNLITLAVILLVIVVILVLARTKGFEKGEVPVSDTYLESVRTYEDSVLASSAKADSLRRDSYKKRRYYHQTSYPAQDGGQNDHGKAQDKPWQESQHDKTVDYRAKRMLVFDINEADTLDFQQLRGIGPVYAKRIVKYRELLGGFVSLDQITEVYGVTPEMFAQWEPQLTIDAPKIRYLDLNTATVDDLKRHPYLDYYKAKAVVNYRQKGGVFHSVEDMRKVTLIDDDTFRKIKPYLTVK